VCEVCLFVEVLQFAKTSANSRKKKRRLPLGNFLLFWGSTLIFIVYVACPGDDADEFLLPLYKKLF
jgi:hypothetical protein